MDGRSRERARPGTRNSSGALRYRAVITIPMGDGTQYGSGRMDAGVANVGLHRVYGRRCVRRTVGRQKLRQPWPR